MNSADESFYLANTIDSKGTEIAVTSITGKIPESFKTKRLFLCSDICRESYVNERKLPVLCELRVKNTGYIQGYLAHFVFLKIIRPSIESLRLYIADDNCNIVSFPTGMLKCALLLKNEFF